MDSGRRNETQWPNNTQLRKFLGERLLCEMSMMRASRWSFNHCWEEPRTKAKLQLAR